LQFPFGTAAVFCAGILVPSPPELLEKGGRNFLKKINITKITLLDCVSFAMRRVRGTHEMKNYFTLFVGQREREKEQVSIFLSTLFP
jgi:hypothetical protein